MLTTGVLAAPGVDFTLNQYEMEIAILTEGNKVSITENDLMLLTEMLIHWKEENIYGNFESWAEAKRMVKPI